MRISPNLHAIILLLCLANWHHQWDTQLPEDAIGSPLCIDYIPSGDKRSNSVYVPKCTHNTKNPIHVTYAIDFQYCQDNLERALDEIRVAR